MAGAANESTAHFLLLIGLTIVTGLVDALSYLSLGHVRGEHDHENLETRSSR